MTGANQYPATTEDNHAEDDTSAAEEVRVKPITKGNALKLRDIVRDKLGMIDTLHATVEASKAAKEIAGLSLDLLSDAVTQDPSTIQALGGSKGTLGMLAHYASTTHQHQTGHSLEGVRVGALGPEATPEDVLSLLEVVKAKTLDSRWDGTTGSPGGASDPTTANLRRATALEALSGVGLIAEASVEGQALVTSESAHAMVDYLDK